MFNKKNLTIAIISIVILAIVSGSTFWYLNQGSEEIIVTLEDNKQEEALENWDNAKVWPEEKFIEEDYEGWKEYVNEEFGYSLKYPKDWIFEDDSEFSSSHTIQIYPQNREPFIAYIGIGRDHKKQTLEEYADVLSKNSKRIKIKFNEVKAYQFIEIDNTESKYRSILVSDNNGIVYSITTYKYNMKEIKQIFASFQFIK